MKKDKISLLGKYSKNIKSAGFGYIKVEFEAELERGDLERVKLQENDCQSCSGSGILGESVCTACLGEGVTSEDFDPDRDRDLQRFYENSILPKSVKNSLVYSKMYHDGSVDTEYTFTLPIDKSHYVIDMIEGWNEMVEAIGAEQDVYGAGMHISLLTEREYPSGNTLPSAKISNFKEQLIKLLPSMFLLASSGKQSRSLQYRFPRIASNTKYSAVFTHRDTCIEYRLFETCYERPEAFIEFVGMIDRTLDYYRDETLKVSSMMKKYILPESSSETSRLVQNTSQVQIIKQQLKLVKPMGYTIKELMEPRGVNLSVMETRKLERENKKKIVKRFQIYREREIGAAKRILERHISRPYLINGYDAPRIIRTAVEIGYDEESKFKELLKNDKDIEKALGISFDGYYKTYMDNSNNGISIGV